MSNVVIKGLDEKSNSEAATHAMHIWLILGFYIIGTSYTHKLINY